MTLRTDRTGDDTEPPGLIPDVADDLADMLRRGRVLGVKRLKRLVMIDEDGEKTSIALPLLPTAESTSQGRDDLPELKDLERDILRVLRESGRRMKALDIASMIDPDQDPYDGSFSRAIKRLKGFALIEGGKQEGGYALKTK